jgi:hypothetical protein
MTYPYSDTTSTPAGWTCGKCGVYVPSGTYHGCTTRNEVPNLISTIPGNTFLERIATTLEKILEILEEKR